MDDPKWFDAEEVRQYLHNDRYECRVVDWVRGGPLYWVYDRYTEQWIKSTEDGGHNVTHS